MTLPSSVTGAVVCFCAVLCATGGSATAQPATSNQPLLRDLDGNRPAWRDDLARHPDLTARDAHGNTALHLAAWRRNAAAVDALLAAGADPNAANDARATPLHYAVPSEPIVRALLAHGAKPSVISTAGVSPLHAALAIEGGLPVVKLLVDAGADVNAPIQHRGGYAPLVMATQWGDLPELEFLLDHGASPNVKEGVSPLAGAAFVGNVGMVRLLLDRGADINYDSNFAGPALNWAMYADHPGVVTLLVERGANLAQKSPMGYGTAPIIWTAYNERGDAALTRLLVARHVDINTPNEAGETALSYALKRGPDTPLVRYLHELGARPSAPTARPKLAPARKLPANLADRPALIRERAQQAIDLLQVNSTAFLNTGFVRDQAKCISCHQQTLPAMAFGEARERGLHVDEQALGQQVAAQMGMWMPQAENARELDEPVPDAPVSVGYGMAGLAALRCTPDDALEAMSAYLLDVQRRDGGWMSFDRRPPLEDGPIIGTAWAVRALQLYPPHGRESDVANARRRARAWLAAQQPETANQRVHQLLGLVWSGATPEETKPLIDALLGAQLADGGWAQLSSLPADAWATGSTLFALHEAGVTTTTPAYRAGVDFLLRTQLDDGSWWVRSRTWPFQPHFDGHFPHGKDQWISAAGTAWATLALLAAVEPVTPPEAIPDARLLAARYETTHKPRAAAAAMPAGAITGAPRAVELTFARDIQPLLERSCAKCHNAEKHKGDFNLASRETLLKGGQSGDPAIVPGHSEQSHLLRYVSDQVEDLEMPPLARRDDFPALTAAEIQRIRAWIDAGAPWAAGN